MGDVIMARSDNWRINKSALLPVEGAQVLKALRKVAGAVGLPSDFTVKFATQETGSHIEFTGKEVSIGAGRLFKEAPVPAEDFDVMVGLTLHEVGHYVVQTENAYRGVQYSNAELEEKLYHDFVNIGEDIVVESHIMADKNLVDYANALHAWATSQMRPANPCRLLELWIEYALGHKPDALFNLPPELDAPMSQLVALTAWLRHKQAPSERATAYDSYWRALRDFVLHPPPPTLPDNPQPTPPAGADNNETPDSGASTTESQSAPAPQNQDEPSPWDDWGKDEAEEPADKEDGEDTESDSEPGDSDELDDEDDMENPSAETDSVGTKEPDKGLENPLNIKPEDTISESLAKEIEDAIQSDSEDITKDVVSQFNDYVNGKLAIIRSRENKTPLVKPDPVLCNRLGKIMTIRKRLQSRIMHGENYGRIDKRHLHRVSTDKRIFNLKYKFPSEFPNTRILIDLSGSMSGQQAREVLQAAGAMQALVNAQVWCYNDRGYKVNLVRVDDGKFVHQFEPDGGTPSGLAIVGVSLGMRRGGLIVHLTDGEHNSGQAPWNAHWLVKEHGIELVNLIWGRHVQHYQLDGMNFRKLDGLADFPDALYDILVQQAKLGTLGGR